MAESWRLKLDRAQHHVLDLKREIAAYAKDDSYKLVPVDPRPKCHQHGGTCWDYQLVMTRQPNPMVAVIAGDILFNVRSALDHLAVAMVLPQRKGKTSFPIEIEHIWERKNRRFVVRNPDGRRRFRTATEGMPDGAVAIIKSLQPYNAPRDERDQEALYQLSRLNNADKHRQLVAFASGLLHVICEVSVGGEFERKPILDVDKRFGFAPDGAHVFHFATGPRVAPKSEVHVQVSGTPVVGIKIVSPDGHPDRAGYMNIEELFALLLPNVSNHLFPALEPYVRRR